MTICNMSIEAGARAGMVAPDQTTFDYLEGRPHAPKGADWDAAVAYWRTLPSDDDAVFDAEVFLDADELEPFVTWGTNPGQGTTLAGEVPDPAAIADPQLRDSAQRALEYMDLQPGTRLKDIKVDAVFMGSCTNSRIEDLRAFASVVKGRQKAEGVRVMVVPGSARVRLEAEAEGLDQVFLDFGAEWRFAGCSMCLGMNPDQLAPGERCASTSNRNFEGRQGKGGRTHLVSPLVAAATAIRGTLSSARPTSTRRGPGLMDAVHHLHRHRRAAEAGGGRHRPDHPGRLPEAGHEDRLRGRAVRDAPRRSDVRAERPGVRAGLGPVRRPGLRHGLQPRARGLGAARLRLPRRVRAAVRRHLPRQLRQAGPADRRAARGRDRDMLGRDRSGSRVSRLPSTSRRGPSPFRGRRTRSRSMPTLAGGSWRASTTSDSPFATRRASPSSKQGREAWRPRTLPVRES